MMDPDHRYLDPRCARPLTSREIAKVLSGLLTTIICVAGKDAGRHALDQSAFLLLPDVSGPLADPNAQLGTLAAIFASACGVFLGEGWCQARSVQQALRFLLAHFDHFVEQAAKITEADALAWKAQVSAPLKQQS